MRRNVNTVKRYAGHLLKGRRHDGWSPLAADRPCGIFSILKRRFMEPSSLFETDEVKSRSSKAWSAIITYYVITFMQVPTRASDIKIDLGA